MSDQSGLPPNQNPVTTTAGSASQTAGSNVTYSNAPIPVHQPVYHGIQAMPAAHTGSPSPMNAANLLLSINPAASLFPAAPIYPPQPPPQQAFVQPMGIGDLAARFAMFQRFEQFNLMLELGQSQQSQLLQQGQMSSAHSPAVSVVSHGVSPSSSSHHSSSSPLQQQQQSLDPIGGASRYQNLSSQEQPLHQFPSLIQSAALIHINRLSDVKEADNTIDSKIATFSTADSSTAASVTGAPSKVDSLETLSVADVEKLAPSDDLKQASTETPENIEPKQAEETKEESKAAVVHTEAKADESSVALESPPAPVSVANAVEESAVSSVDTETSTPPLKESNEPASLGTSLTVEDPKVDAESPANEDNRKDEGSSEEKESDLEQDIADVAIALVDQTCEADEKLTPPPTTVEETVSKESEEMAVLSVEMTSGDESFNEANSPNTAAIVQYVTQAHSAEMKKVSTRKKGKKGKKGKKAKSKDDVRPVEPATRHDSTTPPVDTTSSSALTNVFDLVSVKQPTAITTSPKPSVATAETAASSSTDKPSDKGQVASEQLSSFDLELILQNPDWSNKKHKNQIWEWPVGLLENIGRMECWISSTKTEQMSANYQVLKFARQNPQIFGMSTEKQVDDNFKRGFSPNAKRILISHLPTIIAQAAEAAKNAIATAIAASAAMQKGSSATASAKKASASSKQAAAAARKAATAATTSAVATEPTVGKPETSQFAPGAVTDSSIFPPAAAAIPELVPSVSGSFSAETSQAVTEVSSESMYYVPITTMTKPVWVEVPPGLEFALRMIDTATLAEVAVFANKRRGSQPIVDPSVTIMKKGVPYDVLQKYLKSTGEKFIPFKVEPSVLIGPSSPPPTMDTSSADNLQFIEPSTESASSRTSKRSSRRPAATADAASVASVKSATSDRYEDAYIASALNLDRSARRKGQQRSASATGSNAGSSSAAPDMPADSKPLAASSIRLGPNCYPLPQIATDSPNISTALLYHLVKELEGEDLQMMRQFQNEHLQEHLREAIKKPWPETDRYYFENPQMLEKYYKAPADNPAPDPTSAKLPIGVSIPGYMRNWPFYGRKGRQARLHAQQRGFSISDYAKEKKNKKDESVIEAANKLGAAVYSFSPAELSQIRGHQGGDIGTLNLSAFISTREYDEKEGRFKTSTLGPQYHMLKRPDGGIPESNTFEWTQMTEQEAGEWPTKIEAGKVIEKGLGVLKLIPTQVVEITRALLENQPDPELANDEPIFTTPPKKFAYSADLQAAMEAAIRGDPDLDVNHLLDLLFQFSRDNPDQLYINYPDIVGSGTAQKQKRCYFDESNTFTSLNGLAVDSHGIKHSTSQMTFAPATPSTVSRQDMDLPAFIMNYFGHHVVLTLAAKFNDIADNFERRHFPRLFEACSRASEHNKFVYDMRLLAAEGADVGVHILRPGDCLVVLDGTRLFSFSIGPTASLWTSVNYGSPQWCHVHGPKFIESAKQWKEEQERAGTLCHPLEHNYRIWATFKNARVYSENVGQLPFVSLPRSYSSEPYAFSFCGIPSNPAAACFPHAYLPAIRDSNHFTRCDERVGDYAEKSAPTVRSGQSSSRSTRSKTAKKRPIKSETPEEDGSDNEALSEVLAKSGAKRLKMESIEDGGVAAESAAVVSTQRSGRGKHKLLGTAQTVDFASLLADGVVDAEFGNNDDGSEMADGDGLSGEGEGEGDEDVENGSQDSANLSDDTLAALVIDGGIPSDEILLSESDLTGIALLPSTSNAAREPGEILEDGSVVAGDVPDVSVETENVGL